MAELYFDDHRNNDWGSMIMGQCGWSLDSYMAFCVVPTITPPSYIRTYVGFRIDSPDHGGYGPTVLNIEIQSDGQTRETAAWLS